MRNAECGVRNKKVIAIALFILFVVGAAYPAQDQQINQKIAVLEKIQGKFTFVVLGDNRTGDDQYRTLVSMIAARKPDFVINTGDMIATPGDKQQWANFWSLSAPIPAPYFLVLGNHDAHPKVAFSERTYQEQVDLPGNELYYSFAAGKSLFIILDSFIEGQEKKITGDQFTWLKGVLAQPGFQHKFVFLHHPLSTEAGKGHHSGDSLDKYPQDRDQLEALFVSSKVDAVFAGHEHYYQRKSVDGITHVITGGGGAPMYEKDENGGFYHFLVVSVDGDKVNAEVVDISGNVRDKF